MTRLDQETEDISHVLLVGGKVSLNEGVEVQQNKLMLANQSTLLGTIRIERALVYEQAGHWTQNRPAPAIFDG